MYLCSRQALWNYLIDTSRVIDALGEDEADFISNDLLEYLGLFANAKLAFSSSSSSSASTFSLLLSVFFFSPLFQMKSVYSRALHRIRCGSNLPSLPLIYSNVYKHRCRTIIHRATRPTMSTTTNVTMWKMHIFTVTDSKNGCKIFSTGRTKGTIFTLMMLCGTGSDNGSATHANNRTISSNL